MKGEGRGFGNANSPRMSRERGAAKETENKQLEVEKLGKVSFKEATTKCFEEEVINCV